jgi:Cytochrome c7 and related cytochrome c
MNKHLKWVVVTVAVAVLALVASSSVQAKPSFVKGAKCAVCHAEKPYKKETLTAKAAEMVKMHKTDECKNCHSWEDGKFVSKKK